MASDERTVKLPRKSEKVAWWLFGGMVALYALSLFAEWVHLNLGALLIISVVLIVILLRILREPPPVDYRTCLEACWLAEKQYTGVLLPTTPRNAEVIPDGPLWIAFFWSTGDSKYPVAYRYDPVKRAVVGREISSPELILKRMEQSKILSGIASRGAQRAQERDALERGGVDSGVLDEEDEL